MESRITGCLHLPAEIPHVAPKSNLIVYDLVVKCETGGSNSNAARIMRAIADCRCCRVGPFELGFPTHYPQSLCFSSCLHCTQPSAIWEHGFWIKQFRKENATRQEIGSIEDSVGGGGGSVGGVKRSPPIVAQYLFTKWATLAWVVQSRIYLYFNSYR